MITYRSFLAFMLRFAVAQAAHYPVGITNCGISEWIDKVPQRAVTMNQGTTEVMLALGLEDHMVGTAYLDDEIWPELADSYRRVTVLNERGYPDAADLFAVQPDFIYGSYSSAFATSSVNYTQHIGECNLTIEQSNESNRTFCRQELHDQGIQTYLQKPYCEQIEHRPDAVTLDVLFSEIWDIATIFNAFENARQLVDSIDDHFDMAIQISEAVSGKEPIRALWLDGWDDETPFVGACCGAVQVILEHAGAKNIFESLGLEEKKSWDSVPWEEIATLDPDLIVLVDAAWDLADEKLFHLCQHPVASTLRAVQNRAFITVPFSGSTLGVRIGSLAFNLAEAMAALARGHALPAVEFSEVAIAGSGMQATSNSGLRVYTQLPTFNDTDLEETCPGSSNLKIRNIPAVTGTTDDKDKDTLEGWAIGLLSGLAVLALGTAVALMIMVSREKSGNPIFVPIKDGATTA